MNVQKTNLPDASAQSVAAVTQRNHEGGVGMTHALSIVSSAQLIDYRLGEEQ